MSVLERTITTTKIVHVPCKNCGVPIEATQSPGDDPDALIGRLYHFDCKHPNEV
jgi:hypothetical protein